MIIWVLLYFLNGHVNAIAFDTQDQCKSLAQEIAPRTIGAKCIMVEYKS